MNKSQIKTYTRAMISYMMYVTWIIKKDQGESRKGQNRAT